MEREYMRNNKGCEGMGRKTKHMFKTNRLNFQRKCSYQQKETEEKNVAVYKQEY